MWIVVQLTSRTAIRNPKSAIDLMATPTAIAAYVALFALTGFLFLFANLVVGWLVRPRLPNVEKLEVYECGEPTIGSSFVQFDLRFYVVALLFIIFDVEVAFFFPWAAVFGKATQLAAGGRRSGSRSRPESAGRSGRPVIAPRRGCASLGVADCRDRRSQPRWRRNCEVAAPQTLALTSFADIGVFFGVLLVGFAYVWKRGDLDWVRAVTRQRARSRLIASAAARALEPSQSILSA